MFSTRAWTTQPVPSASLCDTEIVFSRDLMCRFGEGCPHLLHPRTRLITARRCNVTSTWRCGSADHYTASL